jgi:hypothetical protein
MRLTEILNLSQINGAVRIIVPAFCTWLAAKGLAIFGDVSTVTQVTAFAIAAVAVVWQIMATTDHAKLKAAAAVDPQIKVLVPDHVMLSNAKIADVVADPHVPNVTALRARA